MNKYFIYCRKSSEAEDRQVLSIDSQTAELKKIADKLNLNIAELFTESRSAKAPGRPVFKKMVQKINQGKASGVICWKLDRLARNPIDGGQIIWLLQKGIIKHIQTFDRAYYPEDNVLLMNVEFGMANQFVLDLSKNVKRGLRAKLEKGWRPNLAPLGYLNDKTQGKGKNILSKDPDRFELIKKMWKLMISGRYTPPKILSIANNKWGLRTRSGKTLSRSMIYRIFSNSFYTGHFESPKESGNWYIGKHEPMISLKEYDKVQILLGKKGNPRAKKYNFPFRGLIQCGECGGTITPDKKNQIICSRCHYKFSYNNRHSCPRCQMQIETMENPVILNYLYYRCTKKRNPGCTQGSIEFKKLTGQIDKTLSRIQISERFKNWAIKYLREESKKEEESRENILNNQRKTYDGCLKRIDNLLQLKISPMNADGSLLSDEEYAKRKTELIKEKARLEEILNDQEQRIENWLENADKAFEFACYAKYWFKNSTPEEKTQILETLGSNLTLTDKKLQIELKKPFYWLSSVSDGCPEVKPGFEPKKRGTTNADSEAQYLKSPTLRGALDEVRTWMMENGGDFYNSFPPTKQ
jgi:site-specific DNA recombinase